MSCSSPSCFLLPYVDMDVLLVYTNPPVMESSYVIGQLCHNDWGKMVYKNIGRSAP